jgi:SAM-dependent methyltransferase
MPDQSYFWSRVAPSYEEEFIDPYRPDVHNPLFARLTELRDPQHKTAIDLGCGIGPLLPFLAERFQTVHAVDFADGMLQRARQRCRPLTNVEFRKGHLTELTELAGRIDVAVAVNSLVMPDIAELEASLRQARALLRPGGRFLGIVPAMDAEHYVTMLLLDRALDRGLPQDTARRNAAHHADHQNFDFAFGEFRYQGLEQHFWQPFEVRHRLRRAGFARSRMVKVLLAWKQFACGSELEQYPPPWDWFFEAAP